MSGWTAYAPLAAVAARLHGPHIDYSALSPFEALIAGSVVVLLVGLMRSRFAREQLVPALTLVALAATLGMTIWQWNDHVSAIAGALAVDDLTLALTLVFVAAGATTVLLSWRAAAPREAAHCEYHSPLLGLDRGHGGAGRGAGPDHALHRDRAAVDPALRARARANCVARPCSSRGSST